MGSEISLYQGARHGSITLAAERVGHGDLQEFVGHGPAHDQTLRENERQEIREAVEA